MKKIVFHIILTLICLNTFASEEVYRGHADDIETTQDMLQGMQDALSAINKLNLSLASGACDPSLTIPNNADQKCIEKYANFYNKPVIDMRMVFGYLDVDDESTQDQLEREAFVTQLTTPCSAEAKNIHMCGFEKDSDDADKFSKEITDPFGAKHKVIFTVASSSYSDSIKLNRKNSERQKEQSAKAKATFIGGLQNADAVFYSGHSRDGGGPDFNPPIMKKNGHVDYSWYHKNRPGLKDMIEALNERKKAKGENDTPKLLGIMSCFSAKHFKKDIETAAPKTGLLMLKDFGWTPDDPYIIAGMINGILGQVCEPGFSKSINGNRKIDKSSTVYNFNFL